MKTAIVLGWGSKPDEKGRHIEERSSLQGKSVGQKLDEKEYGLEVGWKRVWIKGWMRKEYGLKVEWEKSMD